MIFRDYYKTLKIFQNATQEEIKAAFRKLAKRFHPDVNTAPGASDKFVEINEAFEVLSDPEKRRVYDERYFKTNRSINSDKKQSYKERDNTQFKERSASKQNYKKDYSDIADEFFKEKYDFRNLDANKDDWGCATYVVSVFLLIQLSLSLMTFCIHYNKFKTLMPSSEFLYQRMALGISVLTLCYSLFFVIVIGFLRLSKEKRDNLKLLTETQLFLIVLSFMGFPASVWALFQVITF